MIILLINNNYSFKDLFFINNIYYLMTDQPTRLKGKKDNQEERNYNIKVDTKDKFTYNVSIKTYI